MRVLFAPERPYDELVRQASDDMAAWIAFYENYGGREDNLLLCLGGARLRSMKQDPEVTKGCLEGSERNLRLAALFLVYDYWDNHPLFAPNCLKIAFDDSDEVARGLALLCLPCLYSHFDDPQGILKMLLKEVVIEDIGPMIPEIERSVDEAQETTRWAAAKNEQLWRQAAGDALDQMLSSPSEAEKYLDHADHAIRWVALGVLTFHWRPTKIAADSAELTAKDEAMPLRVRTMACQLLATYYRFSSNRRIGMLLAQIVMDENQDLELREVAYLHLHDIRGISVERPTFDVDFPSEVDWAFVNGFLRN